MKILNNDWFWALLVALTFLALFLMYEPTTK